MYPIGNSMRLKNNDFQKFIFLKETKVTVHLYRLAVYETVIWMIRITCFAYRTAM